ncbi:MULTISPECIES: hypothetical protein [unclassified Leucobacter]|uniref:hypothetical protein n=1 Tax=unclassified Leucobacter TaxID=2621730 RepID=UPI000620E603|nr:hypothetical protein [Leucobacter sp. Ag1]KKI18709.1 hypothetical protein XM48_10530 [Leucobacter sp. Ag1]
MARFGGRALGDGFYAEPDWWPEYLRLEREEADRDGQGVDSRQLWEHALEHWRDYVLPDLARFYPALPIAEARLLARPWRSLREFVLALFATPDSLTGATFAHRNTPKE